MPETAYPFENEVLQAARWLSKTLLPVNSPDLALLERCIRMAMNERYDGHWYQSEPHRGCAFRALTCNGTGLDQLLQCAIRQAKLRPEDFPANDFTMWVNPGEVKVLLGSGVRQAVFAAGSKKANPYDKPRVHIEPTRLNVSANDPSSTRPSSRTASASSSPALSPSLSPFALEFAPVRGRAQSESGSESDGELEVATSRQTAPGLLFSIPPQAGLPSILPPKQLMAWPLPTAGGWYSYDPYAVEAH